MRGTDRAHEHAGSVGSSMRGRRAQPFARAHARDVHLRPLLDLREIYRSARSVTLPCLRLIAGTVIWERPRRYYMGGGRGSAAVPVAGTGQPVAPYLLPPRCARGRPAVY